MRTQLQCCKCGASNNLEDYVPGCCPSCGGMLLPDDMNTRLSDRNTGGIVPLGDNFSFSSTAAETFKLHPTHGRFEMVGVRMFNNPDEVQVLRITTGGSDLAWNPFYFDAASYNSQVRDYWDAKWGTITKENPLHITAVPYRDHNVRLKISLYGKFHHGFPAVAVKQTTR